MERERNKHNEKAAQSTLESDITPTFNLEDSEIGQPSTLINNETKVQNLQKQIITMRELLERAPSQESIKIVEEGEEVLYQALRFF